MLFVIATFSLVSTSLLQDTKVSFATPWASILSSLWPVNLSPLYYGESSPISLIESLIVGAASSSVPVVLFGMWSVAVIEDIQVVV